VVVFFIGAVFFAKDLSPLAFIEDGEKHIARHIGLHLCEVDFVEQVHGLPIDVASSDDKCFRLPVFGGDGKGFSQGMGDQAAGCQEEGIA
jgi:hypothetical protein